MSVLVLLEHHEGAVLETSLQALSFAESLGSKVRPVSFGSDSPSGGLVVEHEILTDYAPEAWAESLHQLASGTEVSVVVAAGTERGNEVLAHLAAMTDLPLATNVTKVDASAGDWELTRIRWGGSLLEQARLSAPLKLLTVALHTWPAWSWQPGQSATFIPQLSDQMARTRVTERVTVTAGTTLATAKVVVSGGRGVGSAEGFALLEELAGLLGGAVGCSRVVTNSGWRPHSDQVGQTGTRVAPQLYIACGISGAIQHWVGMMAAKKVLAINIDKDAPMVTKADYAVIGNLHDVLPAVLDEIRRAR